VLPALGVAAASGCFGFVHPASAAGLEKARAADVRAVTRLPVPVAEDKDLLESATSFPDHRLRLQHADLVPGAKALEDLRQAPRGVSAKKLIVETQ
jgi:hypothetical protein